MVERQQSTASFPAGIITGAVADIAGPQTTEIHTHDAQTLRAAMTIRWGAITMRFTSAEQVQHLLGYFAMARQGMQMMRTATSVPLPTATDVDSANTMIAITWTRTPDAVATREQIRIPAMRRTIEYVALKVGPVTFRILDTDGLTSSIELLAKAHKLAVATWPDGHEYRANPQAMSWRPRAARMDRTGGRWIPRP